MAKGKGRLSFKTLPKPELDRTPTCGAKRWPTGRKPEMWQTYADISGALSMTALMAHR